MDKFLLFTTGGATTDPLALDSSEVAMYNASSFKGMKPQGPTGLDLFFETDHTREVVTLEIKNRTHSKIMESISSAIANGSQSVIPVADVDNNKFISSSIYGVTIKTSNPIYTEKIVNATQVNVIPINTKTKKLKAMTLCNIHSAEARVTVFLSNSTDNWYIIKDVVIPIGATLVLESDELDYDGDIFNLYVKLQGATPVDVIIR